MRWKKDCSWERNNASSVPASDPENARPPSWKHMNSNERPKDPSYLTPRTEKCARHLLCTCIFHRDTNEIALGKSSLDARYTSLPSPSPWNTTARAGIQQRNLAEILNKTRCAWLYLESTNLHRVFYDYLRRANTPRHCGVGVERVSVKFFWNERDFAIRFDTPISF